jgi:hypothetical protein
MGRSLLILVLLLVSTTARAQDGSQRAEAIALFDEARALMQKGDYAAACPKLQQAQRLSPGVGILYNLADCQEHTGKLASAWAGFREAAALAASSGQTEREADARKRAQALEPRLVRLQIEVEKPVPGLRVTRNDVELGEAQWGVALPVDPSLYVVKAEAPGQQPWQTTITADQEGRTLKVVVPRLSDAGGGPPPAPVPDAAPDAAPAPAPPPQPEPLPTYDDRPWQMPLGVGLFAVGGAALVATAALAGVAKSKADGADCDEADLCSQDGVDRRDEALLLGNVATGLLVGGAVVGGIGLVVWLTAPSASSSEAALRIGPSEASLSVPW